MKERIISSKVRWADWGDGGMWEMVVSSALHRDAHYGGFYEKQDRATAQRRAESMVGKVATFEGSRNVVAYID